MLHTVKLTLAHALEHTAPDLGVAPQGIDRLGREGVAVGAEPLLTGVVAVLAEQINIGHVLIRQGHGPAALQHQHPLAGSGQLTGQGATGGTAANHDHVVVEVVDDHGRSAATARRRSTERG